MAPRFLLLSSTHRTPPTEPRVPWDPGWYRARSSSHEPWGSQWWGSSLWSWQPEGEGTEYRLIAGYSVLPHLDLVCSISTSIECRTTT